MRKWGNDILGNSLGLSEDTICALSEKDILFYFPTKESRQAKPTEWAIMHGIRVDDDGNSSYWTITPSSNYFDISDCVHHSGLLCYFYTNDSSVGVRPTIKI